MLVFLPTWPQTVRTAVMRRPRRHNYVSKHSVILRRQTKRWNLEPIVDKGVADSLFPSLSECVQ
jgi:hypothetical protein